MALLAFLFYTTKRAPAASGCNPVEPPILRPPLLRKAPQRSRRRRLAPPFSSFPARRSFPAEGLRPANSSRRGVGKPTASRVDVNGAGRGGGAHERVGGCSPATKSSPQKSTLEIGNKQSPKVQPETVLVAPKRNDRNKGSRWVADRSSMMAYSCSEPCTAGSLSKTTPPR